MTKSNIQDEATKEQIKLFCDRVFWLNQLHYIYTELFENKNALSIMEKIAHRFFYDINNILVDYFLLEVAKLTDPAYSQQGKCENFTTNNLLETIDWPQDCLKELESLNKDVMSFRKYIKHPRNKIFTHLDKKTLVSNSKLGEFPEGKEKECLQALEKMCNIMHEAVFGEILGDMIPFHNGDVQDFKKALLKAIAFDKLFSESKGADRNHLADLIKQAQNGKI